MKGKKKNRLSYNCPLIFSTASVSASIDCLLAPFALAIDASNPKTFKKESFHFLTERECGGFHLDTRSFLVAVTPAKNTFFCKTGKASVESSFSNRI